MSSTATLSGSATAAGDVPAVSRRDFLKLVTLSSASIGIGAIGWAFIDSMNPDAATIAAVAPIDVSLDKLGPGQQVIVLWRGTPISIVHRPPAALEELRSAAVRDRLSDPDSEVFQQPPYARNWHRSLRPEYAVLVAVCTHLGCLPECIARPAASYPARNWPGGYFCHCHGSKYDLAGRVFRGVPAPFNLPVPPYHFPADKTVRVGANPPGQNFSLGSIVQI